MKISSNNFSFFFIFSKKPVITGIVVFTVLLSITQYLSYQRYLLRKDEQQRQIINQANITKERMQQVVSHCLSTTQTLAYLVEHYGVPDNFDEVAKQLLKTNSFIDAVQLVTGGVITHTYPLQGNEAAIGYNIIQSPVTKSGAIIAINRNDFFIAGPLKLKQGGIGIVSRVPIFINNNFWGFSAVITKLPTLFKAVGIDTTSQDLHFQFSKVNLGTREEENFLPDRQLLHNAYSVPIEIPNGEWKLYVMSEKKNAFLSVSQFIILGFLLSITGGVFAWFISLQPIRLNKMVEEKTALLQLSEKNYRTTLERVTNGFLSIDNNSNCTYMNKMAGKLTNHDPETMIGKNIWTEFSISHDQLFYSSYTKAIKEQKYVYVEEYYPEYNNWFEIHIYPSQDGTSIFFRNITEKKKSEQQSLQLTEQLRKLTAHIQSVSETERTAIAREIHDVLGQQMTAIKYDISWLKKKITSDDKETNGRIDSMNKITDEAIQSIRKISSELRPRILDDLGLNAAIEWYTQEFQKNTGILCTVESNIEDLKFDKKLSITIYRILQEALTNAARHSKANEIKISILHKNNQLILIIKDNGIGITVARKENTHSLGLLGMNERAKMISGILEISDIEGQGTSVKLTVPLS